MAGINGPKIVTDKLNVCFDAADRKSYTGSGATVFRDLSGNNKNGSIIDSATFSGTNGGELYCNMGYIDMGNPITNSTYSLTAMSFCIWLKIPSSQPWGGSKNICVSSNAGATFGLNMRYDTSNNLSFEIKRSTGDTAGVWSTFIFDTIFNIVGTYDGSYIRMYVNGSEIGSGTSWSGTIHNNANSFTIGGWSNDYSAMRAYLYNVMIYNKALSSTEVLQNFNAVRRRFSI